MNHLSGYGMGNQGGSSGQEGPFCSRIKVSVM
jgi:hypothetical protein